MTFSNGSLPGNESGFHRISLPAVLGDVRAADNGA